MADRYTARAELVLAHGDLHPLAEVGLRPDPLTRFARVFEQLRPDLEETASVVVDLLPLSAAERRRHRRRLAAAARHGRRGPAGAGLRQQLLGGAAAVVGSPVDGAVRHIVFGGRPSRPGGPGGRRAARDPVELLEQREDLRLLAARLRDLDAGFRLQVLIRVSSTVKGRPQQHLAALLSCFDQFAGHNYFRVAGQRLGPVFAGADLPGRRRRFDRRADTGLFAPAKRSVVSAREVAALLKPPTAACPAANVVRLVGALPPAGLPEFSYQPDLLPLGRVLARDGTKVAGVRVEDSLFSYMAGRSRYGKTETALNQFLQLARTGHGCFFLDPHADGLDRIRPYLTDVADRVVEINLAGRGAGHRQAAWNLFSMEGLAREHLEHKLGAVVDSFASALRWGEINNRALTITTMAAQSLLELALALPAELAPTIFQLATLLSDDDWRRAALPHLSAATRQFWEHRFKKLSEEAITPVTNLIDRLRSSTNVSALLGASRSSYDIRRAMDEGKIVLACPAGVGDKDRLVANFLVYDLLQAALSRKDTPPQRRRPFYAFFDEVQTYDGASRGNLAALLEQAGKYRLFAFLCNQNPERLTPQTYDAVTTNRSHLATTVVNARAAGLLAREWGNTVAPQVISSLERFTYLISVTLGQQVTAPFLVRGISVDELWAHCRNDDGVAALNAQIDQNVRRRPVHQTIGELEQLDGRIREWLERHQRHQPPPRQPPATGSARPRRASGRVQLELVDAITLPKEPADDP